MASSNDNDPLLKRPIGLSTPLGATGEVAPIKDWFIGAIETDGSVGACLDAVIIELDGRLSFVKVIKDRIAGHSKNGVDAITELSHRIKAMENTLRFRLGMLQADRHGAWFRAPVAQTTGPFSTTLIAEAVLSEYSEIPVSEVRRLLLLRWTEARASDLPFKVTSPNLWQTILKMNEDLEKINQLPAPWHELRLDLLPERLPKSLESWALKAFLANVRAEYFTVRERLDACYKQLKNATENLWEVQIKVELEKAVRDEHLKAESAKARRPWTDSAGDLREEFKRRRQSAQRERAQEARSSMSTSKDVEAWQYMGFDCLPSADSLRQRYLHLAKTYHPDRGGSEDKFKLLTRAYKQLSDRIR